MTNPIRLFGVTVLAVVSIVAVNASVSQAKWLPLLNGVSVTEGSGNLTALAGLLEAENGLKIKCTGGTGVVTAKLVEENKKAVGSASGTLTGCVYVGAESTCTINDGGKGQIKVGGSGELTMVGETTYIKASSTPGAPFTTILTEGAFCTIPEEEEIVGSGRCRVLDPLTDATVKSCHLELDPSAPLKLGNSKVKKLEGEGHATDLNPNATLSIH